MNRFCAVSLLFIFLISHMASTNERDDEYRILINATHPLPEEYISYIESDLVDITFTRNDGRPTQRLRREAAKALDALLTLAQSAGFGDINVTSAYRSREYQARLWNAAVQRYVEKGYDKTQAIRLANRYHARPGESEHESGLAVDMHNLPAANTSFSQTAAFRWLSENAPTYGFILRYPNGKESITGIAFEPWHFRYVGPEHAQKITQNGLTLEEYQKEK